MLKILFLIHDLGQGGAEKVLVNLVNNMDRSKFDISVTSLFGGGINEQFLAPDIHFHVVFPKLFPGNSQTMKLLSPAQLHRMCVKEHYDIEVSYLEGPSARIVSGCSASDTKLVCWIHSTFTSVKAASSSFRSVDEARACYCRFDYIIGVAQKLTDAFVSCFPECPKVSVLYNTVDSTQIISQAALPINSEYFSDTEFSIISMGTMKPVKAFDRIIRIHARLRQEGYPVHAYLLGKGPDLEKLQQLSVSSGYSDTITFLGYDTNPYRYISRSRLFVCSSLSEGFSTAATEALILGVPVCTVEVSGMKEMLGENNEYGIVTENSEEALYQGIKRLLDDPALLAHYKQQAIIRGKAFSTTETVKAVENMLFNL